MAKDISQAQLTRYSKDFNANTQHLLARNALTHVDLNKVAMSRDSFYEVDHTFSHTIKNEGTACNQKASGRCWLFAALNVMRLPLMKKYHLDKFEFSQSYLFFWDKLEKANYFLESILETAHLPIDDRTVMWILENPLSDGGQWHMFVNLVNKYGLVPQSVYPESFQSSHSAKLNAFVIAKLRQYALELRAVKQGKKNAQLIRSLKTEMVCEVYRFLSIFLGEPPQKFDWHFRNKNKRYYDFKNLSPHSFLKKHVPYEVNDKVCLINAPTKDKPFEQVYTVKHLGNVVGGESIKYINLPIQDLQRYSIASLKDNEAVWFGCDVGKHFDREKGVMDLDLYDYPLVFGAGLKQNKAQRLDARQSCMTHAMVFTAVNLKGTKATKWRVENSWGDKSGSKGYCIMTDDWFAEYLYEVAIDKKYLPKKVLSILNKKVKVLNPWDPMGSLA